MMSGVDDAADEGMTWTPMFVAYVAACLMGAIFVTCAGFIGLAHLVGSDGWAVPLLLTMLTWGVSAAGVVAAVSLAAAVIQWGTSSAR